VSLTIASHASVVVGWRAHIADAPVTGSVGELTDELRELESLKCAIEARQARVSLAIDQLVRGDAAAAGVPSDRQGRGVAERIALARRVSPHRGRILLGLAKSLTELPHTMRAFSQGQVSEWRAMIMARETTCLERVDRQQIDIELGADSSALASMGDRELAGRARARAAELDAASVARRRARAEADRCVTIRPAPDTMVYLTALLPVAQGVATYAALKRAADSAVGTGQATSRNQVMADTLVARVTGRGDGTSGQPVHPVALNVTISDASLMSGHTPAGQESAWLDGAGPVPAGLARELLADALDADQRVTLRRLFTRPSTGELLTMESRARLFPRRLAEFIQLRDRFCRTPWCDAPIRHADHVRPAAEGGPTTAANGQGLCEQCNHARQSGFSPPVTASPPLRRPDPPPRRPLVVELYRSGLPLAFEPAA
jgi:hypothetical protein